MLYIWRRVHFRYVALRSSNYGFIIDYSLYIVLYTIYTSKMLETCSVLLSMVGPHFLSIKKLLRLTVSWVSAQIVGTFVATQFNTAKDIYIYYNIIEPIHTNTYILWTCHHLHGKSPSGHRRSHRLTYDLWDGWHRICDHVTLCHVSVNKNWISSCKIPKMFKLMTIG